LRGSLKKGAGFEGKEKACNNVVEDTSNQESKRKKI